MNGTRCYLGIFIAVRRVDAPDHTGVIALLAVQIGRNGPGTFAWVGVYDSNNRPDIFGVRPVLTINAEMLCRIIVTIRYREVTLTPS